MIVGDRPSSGLVVLPLQKFCNSDMNAEVMIEAATPNGQVNQARFNMKDFNTMEQIQGQNGGTITFTRKEIVTMPNFLDYLRGG
jgi:hypothetical protein